MNLLKTTLVVAVYSITLLPFSSKADPYSHCAQILQDGAFNIKKVNQSKSTQRYAQVWLCSQQYRESNTKTGANISAVYGAMSGSGEYNQSNFSKYKSVYCNFDSSAYSAVEKSYMYNQLASSEIINAWEKCISNKNKGLVCNAQQINESDVLFKVNMRHGPAGELTQTIMKMNNLKEIFDDKLEETISEGDEYVFNLSRSDINSPGILKVTGRTNMGTTYCNYRVPVTSNIPLPDIELEKIRRLISTQNYDLGNHLRKYSTNGGGCSVSVHEKLKINTATVSKDKTKINVAYSCTRPDHKYNCGGGWVGPTNASYSGRVSARIKVSGGILRILEVIDHDNSGERNCGNIVAQYLKSINGSAL